MTSTWGEFSDETIWFFVFFYCHLCLPQVSNGQILARRKLLVLINSNTIILDFG